MNVEYERGYNRAKKDFKKKIDEKMDELNDMQLMYAGTILNKITEEIEKEIISDDKDIKIAMEFIIKEINKINFNIAKENILRMQKKLKESLEE